MCYTGKCRYENNEGECILPWSITDYPDDAYCVQVEREQIIEALAEAEAMEEVAAL